MIGSMARVSNQFIEWVKKGFHSQFNQSVNRSFIHSSNDSLHSFTHSFIHSFIQSFIQSFNHSIPFIHSFSDSIHSINQSINQSINDSIHSFNDSIVDSSIQFIPNPNHHPPIHSIHSFTHSLNDSIILFHSMNQKSNSFIHSLIHSFTQFIQFIHSFNLFIHQLIHPFIHPFHSPIHPCMLFVPTLLIISCFSDEYTLRQSTSGTSSSVSSLSYVYFSQSANGSISSSPTVLQYKTTLSSPHHAKPRGGTRQSVFFPMIYLEPNPDSDVFLEVPIEHVQPPLIRKNRDKIPARRRRERGYLPLHAALDRNPRGDVRQC